MLWAKSVGGSSEDRANSVATDVNGNILVTGYFISPTITFGSTTLTNAGNWDMFLAKYDAGGNVLWAKRAGGNSYDEALSVSTDASGNILVAGYFLSPTITFGSTTLTNVNPNGNSNDIFIVKYDTGGNLLWAKSAGGNSYDAAHCISTDASGNIIVTGDFSSTSISFGSTILTNAGNDDMFLAKYDAGGNLLWVKSAGGNAIDEANSVSTDVTGNIYVAGDFSSSSINFGSVFLTNSGNGDVFLAKYDADGNVLWAKSASGGGAYSVSTDAVHNVLLTGIFNNDITFGSTILTNTNLGEFAAFLVKYDEGGNVLWAKSVNGNDDDGVLFPSVATDPLDNVIIAGTFTSTSAIFGSSNLANANAGSGDIFLAKIGSVTEIHELTKDDLVNIYPNPAQSLISFEIGGNSPNVSFEIYDVLGRLRLSEKVKQPYGDIDFTDFEDGIYIINLRSDKTNIWTEKLVKIK